MKKTGFDRVKRILNKLPDEVELTMREANRENGEDVLALARVLIPERPTESDGNRHLIRGAEVPGGGYLMDFGPKSKVIEGEKGPRPFVNPAMEATKERRRKRSRKALRDAVKRAKGNG